MTDKQFLEQLGQSICARRKELGWSQQELADRAGMALPNLAIIENGRTNTSVLTILRIMEAMNIALIGGAEVKQLQPAEEA